MNSKLNIPKSFFGFLIVSILFWLLINLSKQYTASIYYYVEYYKLAQNKIFEKKPVEELKIKVVGTGFKILSANFSKKKLTLSVDKVKNLSDSISYILPNEQKNNIQNQLYSGLKFQKVIQDTIKLHLTTLASKKVPVIPDNAIQFELGYNLSKPIKVSPDSIYISGSKLMLNEIEWIKTKQIKYENLSSSKQVELELENLSENKKIKLSHHKVLLDIAVDKFTEGTFVLPFVIENLPKNVQVNTFPKKVKVAFKVALKDFNKITPEHFTVECDYKSAIDNELLYLVPKIKSKPSLVQSARLLTNKIDFLIQK